LPVSRQHRRLSTIQLALAALNNLGQSSDARAGAPPQLAPTLYERPQSSVTPSYTVAVAADLAVLPQQPDDTGLLTSGDAGGGVFGLCKAECATRTLLEHLWDLTGSPALPLSYRIATAILFVARPGSL
jgi:hypothetical protein